MNTQLLIIFIILNVVNVIFQTLRSLATVKCGKWLASAINAICYGLYTIVLVYTVCELPLFLKAGIVAVCNLIGVFIVKWIEEKIRKDKLWKVEATIVLDYAEEVHKSLSLCNIPHNLVEAGPWTIFNCYCDNQFRSLLTKEILNKYNAKYFVTESKVL